jgi:expansin (peptidoglycan-binding protein)
VNAHWGGCGDPYNPVMAHGQHGDFGQDGLGPGGFGPGGFGPGGFGRRGPRRHRHVRRGGRLPLFGLGVTGAGLAAVAVAAVVGIGQLTGGQTACRTSASAMSLPALSLSALSEQSGTVSGTATHYVLTGLPNCSYPSPPADDLFVALSPPEYDGAAACGGYLTVTGPDGSVTVQVIDQCPDCAAGHIDLSEPAFAKLAPLGAGLINVRYQDLADPPLPGPITMEVKSGSSQYWLALLADNTGNPLASVQVETASGGWISLARASYNYWIAQSGAGAGPFTVRLTDTEGNQVTVRNIDLDPGAVQSTGVYMYGAGSAPAEPADASPPAAPRSGAPATSARASSSVSAASPAASTVERAGAAPVPRLTAAALSPTPSATC